MCHNCGALRRVVRTALPRVPNRTLAAAFCNHFCLSVLGCLPILTFFWKNFAEFVWFESIPMFYEPKNLIFARVDFSFNISNEYCFHFYPCVHVRACVYALNDVLGTSACAIRSVPVSPWLKKGRRVLPLIRPNLNWLVSVR